MANFGLAAATAYCNASEGWTPFVSRLVGGPYDAALQPNQNGPTNVRVQLYVVALEEVQEKPQYFTIAGYFRSYWTDARLSYGSKSTGGCFDAGTVPEAYRSKIWLPDFYWDNALKEEHGADMASLHPSGEVLQSVHIRHTFQCEMDFRRMPYDTQVCTMLVASYSEDTSKVTLAVKDGAGIVLPKNFNGNTAWEILEVVSFVEKREFSVGEWDYVHLKIALRRRSSFYWFAHIMPAALFVLVSWTGFFIDRAVAPARVTISVIPVLIMLNLLNSIYAMLPPLPYVTLLTGYLMVCLFFAVTSVFEYGVVSYLRHEESKHKEQLQVLETAAKLLSEHQDLHSPRAIPSEMKVSFVHSLSPPPRCGNARVNCGALQSVAPTGQPDQESPFEVSHVQVPRRRTNEQLAAREEAATLDTAIGLTPLQRQTWRHAIDVFDRTKVMSISKTCFQRGLRKFGVFYTKAQIEEIFLKLGLEKNAPMSYADLEQFLIRFHEPTMDIHKGLMDDPPSLRLDKIFRVAYITSFTFCLVGLGLVVQFG